MIYTQNRHQSGEQLIGRTLSHYLLEARLGAGGMGEVYRARDLALGRVVAVKVLPAGFGDALRDRLVREAQASARLQHPAIATFYEAGEADGTAFIAMEYVAGRTLRELLKAGPLAPDRAVALVCSLLEALAHAHAAGILHRDIKPENIIVDNEWRAKLLDFGLASFLLVGEDPGAALTAAALTGVGTIVGTVGYMSPEQIRGERVDARTDVFAAGAVLYEALGGRPAFPGATANERIAAILSRDPQPLGGLGQTHQLWPVLQRSLSRDVAARFASARAFLSALHQAAAGQVSVALPDTLAVLDPENLSGNPADDWLGNGIAESLAADLGRARGLHVIAREKMLKVRAALEAETGGIDALDLGLRLGCRWVLTGGFQRMGPALRVTTRLLEVATGRLVAAEKIDAPVDRVFELQDRLGAACLEALQLTVSSSAPAVAVAPPLSAYEAYARGRRLWTRMEKGSFDDARELYEQAVAIEPRYAPALAGLAAVHALRFTFTTDRRELDLAEEYARRAIAADASAGEPHIWLGYAMMRQNRLAEGLSQQQEAARLAPENHFAPYFAGCVLLAMGRPREALPHYQRAMEIDASAGFTLLGLGWTHLWLDRFGEARWCLGKAAELERTGATQPTAGAAAYLGECLRREGALADARRECLAGLDAAERSDHMYRDIFRGVALCALGRTALSQGDSAAARAAFAQAVTAIQGRPRALGGGHLVVQATAGLARAEGNTAHLGAALLLFETRGTYDFSWFFGCADDVTLADLAHAAAALGRPDEARALDDRARACGASASSLPSRGLGSAAAP